MCPPHAMTEVDPDDFGDIPDAPVAADTVIVRDVGEHVLAVRHGVPFDDEDMGAGGKPGQNHPVRDRVPFLVVGLCRVQVTVDPVDWADGRCYGAVAALIKICAGRGA